MPWTTRPAEPGDHDAIRSLFREVFGYQRNPERDRWLAFDSPDGPIVATIAEDAGHIVGYYALLPTTLRLGGETVLGAQSLDTMTHPDYRGQGMFTRLAIATFDLAASRGIKALYGFPNAASYPGFVRKLNWHHVCDIARWTRVLHPSKLASMPAPVGRTADRLAVSVRSRSKSAVVTNDWPDESELAALIERWRSTDPASCFVDRSVPWMKWRFAEESGRSYRWVRTASAGDRTAVAVWGVREDGHGVLSDVLGVDQAAVDQVVRHVVRQAFDAGLPALHSVTNRPIVARALRKGLFLPRKALPLIVRSMTHQNFRGNIHDPGSWLVSAADIDTY